MTKICFVSYEIHPTTLGGCGVLLYNAARVLLAQGHEVIFLLDIPHGEFERFLSSDRLTLPAPDHCTAYRVEALCQDIPLQETDFISLYAWKAYRFHHACQKIIETDQPDTIEFFDYCGVGHYALSAKAAGLAYQKTHLAIRLHTSLELLDGQEATKPLGFDRYSLYAQEHQALRLAETVLYPSRSFLVDAYRPHYEPWFGATVASQPPVVNVPRVSQRKTDQDIALFYGRLFHLKGTDLFVEAAIAYLSQPDNPRLQFYLAGYDSFQPPIGVGSYQAYLEQKIPAPYRSHFVFTGPLTWPQLEELLPRVRFGVFPSYFESFSYAVHEMYAAGIPLIVSDIPGFRDFFERDTNALVFDGTVGDLARQMTRLGNDPELCRALSYPFPIAADPLGCFYTRPAQATWIVPACPSPLPTALICLIEDDQHDPVATLAALDRAELPQKQIVRLRPAEDPQINAAVWFLGKLYSLHDRAGQPLEPTEITTAETLIILRAGDILDPTYLNTGLGLLARQEQIAFVGSWKQRTDQNQPRVQTFPLDLALELVPFFSLPPLSRCLMRTPPDRLLIDLFDPRAGVYGELAYLWDMDTEQHCGLLIPEALIQPIEEPSLSIDPKLLAYLVMRDRSAWRKTRLARYLLTVWGTTDQQQIEVAPLLQRNALLESQLAEVNQSRVWHLIQTYRTQRHHSRVLQAADRYVRQPLWRLLGKQDHDRLR